MQVAKALEHRKRTFAAKVLESFRALQLEWKYNKNEILQLYLNLVPYGGNIEGVKAASLLYFNKNPDHLSLAEITSLSIIPNRPSSLVIGKNNELIVQERNVWLHRFAKRKVFTTKEIEDALSEPLVTKRSVVPHFIPHLAYKLKKQLHENEIKTTIRLNTQLKVEQLTKDYIRTLRLKNIRNASVVIIDNKTKQVITYLGSAAFNDTTDGGQVNGAAAIRQPGSTLKPLLYGLCIDEGLLTPKMVLTDVPVNYNGYAPENYDQKYNGYVTMEYALEHSLNIPAVKSLELIGKEKMISQLVAADFKQIQKEQNGLGLSLILGGCGTTLEQLTALFSAFANGGVYSPPVFTQNTQASKKITLLSPAASYLITNILSKVGRPDFPISWQATENMPKIAWKTGTSYGRKDAWSIGYNKQYTVGVWVGNFSAQGVPELSGSNTATPLLFKIFNSIDYNNAGDWFAPPQESDIRKVCSETGLPPGEYCTNFILDHYIPLVSSTVPCQHLQEIKIAANEKISYCIDCLPAEGYQKKMFRVIAPEMQDYFFQQAIAYDRIPPHNPECEKIFKGSAPFITSPTNGTDYFINKKEKEPLQLTAHTPNDVTKIYWYINDQFYKTTGANEKCFFVPQEGHVKISCTDDKGRNRNIWIKVKYVNL
jgi:penicillin-binding protein 1C